MAKKKRKTDEGHELTDKELAALEKRIAAVYKQAADDMQKTVTDYFAALADRDEIQAQALLDGKITENEYIQWRLTQFARGEGYEAMRDALAARYTDAYEVAIAYVNDTTPTIYSLNRNYAAYTIEQAGENVSFTLYDEQTVKRLIKEEPDLMPYYPKQKAVDRGIDLAYGKKQITASVRSGILQGKSVYKIADDLQSKVSTMSRESAVRAARTAVTEAQNGGRQATYEAAEEMGIELVKEWVCALDSRTREAHQEADGQQVAQDEPFIVGGEELMYPGDHSHGASDWNIYNCRCTCIAQVKGAEQTDAKRWSRDTDTGETETVENVSYKEWQKMKAE